MTSRDRISALLDERRVLLFDGAMGTMLYDRGIFLNRCYDELNCSQPDVVMEIHREYVLAGADIIETNTFGANRPKLRAYGLEDRTKEINALGVRLARKAAAKTGTGDVLVAGSVGHLGSRLEPLGPISQEAAQAAFTEQIDALTEAGVDLLCLETFFDPEELHIALRAARVHRDLYIIAHMSVDQDGRTLTFGIEPPVFVKQMENDGADAVGANCSLGPMNLFEVLERIVPVTTRPISIMPNAGTPRLVQGRNMYLTSPEYLAEYARRYVLAGARFVGGCCGTTPEHTRQMRKAIRSLVPRLKLKTPAHIEMVGRPEIGVEEIPLEKKSRLGAKLAGNGFITLVEVTPPRGCDPGTTLERVRQLKEIGVDGINLPDGPRAMSRMGPLPLSILLLERTGVEPVMHYACRDRNILGMQSDLLGAAAAGIHNLLLITGDPPKMGNIPDATAVFDMDSIGLATMVKKMNQGMDLGGNSIGFPTAFCIGVGVNPGAIDLNHELKRFDHKIEAGAEFAITQPVFDVKILRAFLDRIGHTTIPILAGVWPLVSFRNAEFMNNEVPGASVPDRILDRMRKAQDKGKDAALQEGIAVAREIIETIRPWVRGLQISTPLGRVDVVALLLESNRSIP